MTKKIVSNSYTAGYEERIMVVIDLSSSYFRAVAALADENEKISEILAVSSIESKGMNRGFAYNSEEVMPQVKKLLDNISRKLKEVIFRDMPNDEVAPDIVFESYVVNLSGDISSKHISKSRNLNSERISVALVDDLYRQAQQALASEQKDLFDIRTLEYSVDDEDVMSPVGVCGEHILQGRYLAIKADYTSRYQTEYVFNSKIHKYVLNTEALANVMLSEYDKECGCALVDMGASTTTVAVYQKGLLRNYRVLPFGGNVITDDIRKTICVPASLAEDIKKKMGFASAKKAPSGNMVFTKGACGLSEDKRINVKELANIIEGRLNEMLSYIFGEISYDGVPHTRKVILAGGASNLNELVNKFSAATGLDVEKGMLKQEYINKYGKYFTKHNRIEDFAVCLGMLDSGFVSSVKFVRPVKKSSVPNKKDKDAGFMSKLEEKARTVIKNLFDGDEIY